VLTLEEMGIGVEHAQHEDAPGQHEIDLRYTDALTMADTVMSVRHVVKELARQSGVPRASCPSPSSACRDRACTLIYHSGAMTRTLSLGSTLTD
jgi:hypothetical protein